MAYGSKFAKKTYGKVRRYAKKRYVRKGSGYGTGLRLNKLASDIALVKRSLNTEKKYIDTGEVTAQAVGQSNGNNIGNFALDITPTPSVGTGFSNRIGKSIKAVAMCLEYQFVQQASTSGPRKLKLVIGKVNGTPIAATGANSIQRQVMGVNPITTVFDYNSSRDVDFMKKFTILKTKTIYMKSDNLTGQTMLVSGKCAMKLNHHIQYDDNTTTVTDGQLFWYIVADSGNAGTSAVTSLDYVAVTAANTGVSFQTYTRFWYVDN